MLQLSSVLQFLPLSFFMITYRVMGDWQPAFIAGGITALLQIAIFLYQKIELDRFILAINCFLVGGATMYVFDIAWLQNLYDHFLYTTLFVWLCIIGAITTIFSKNGYLGIPHNNPKMIRAFSLSLLFGTVIATAFSWFFQGDFIFAAVVPWVFLIFLKKTLSAKIQKS